MTRASGIASAPQLLAHCSEAQRVGAPLASPLPPFEGITSAPTTAHGSNELSLSIRVSSPPGHQASKCFKEKSCIETLGSLASGDIIETECDKFPEFRIAALKVGMNPLIRGVSSSL
jgi:hypothetical protein